MYFSLPSPLHFFFGSFLAYLPAFRVPPLKSTYFNTFQHISTFGGHRVATCRETRRETHLEISGVVILVVQKGSNMRWWRMVPSCCIMHGVMVLHHFDSWYSCCLYGPPHEARQPTFHEAPVKDEAAKASALACRRLVQGIIPICFEMFRL